MIKFLIKYDAQRFKYDNQRFCLKLDARGNSLVNCEGMTIIDEAVQAGNLDFAEWLFKKGVSISEFTSGKDQHGNTLLHHAVCNPVQHGNFALSLLEGGADLFEKNDARKPSKRRSSWRLVVELAEHYTPEYERFILAIVYIVLHSGRVHGHQMPRESESVYQNDIRNIFDRLEKDIDEQQKQGWFGAWFKQKKENILSLVALDNKIRPLLEASRLLNNDVPLYVKLENEVIPNEALAQNSDVKRALINCNKSAGEIVNYASGVVEWRIA